MVSHYTESFAFETNIFKEMAEMESIGRGVGLL